MWHMLFKSLLTGVVSDPELARAGEAVKRRARGIFGRSLQVRLVDAGSCNGCEIEIGQLLTPAYDLQRFGIDIVASPRHADALLVTGPVSRNMAHALLATWEATPAPKVVIAAGDCACDGGVIGAGYASAGGVDRVLPVDVRIPGCPPSPRLLLEGLLVAMGTYEAQPHRAH